MAIISENLRSIKEKIKKETEERKIVINIIERRSKQYANALKLSGLNIESLSNMRETDHEFRGKFKIMVEHFLSIRNFGEKGFYLSTAPLWKYDNKFRYVLSDFVIIAIHQLNENLKEPNNNRTIKINGETLSIIISEEAHNELLALLKKMKTYPKKY